MNIQDMILPIFVVAFFGIVLFVLFTRKGRSAFVGAGFGTIIKDHGDLGSSTVRGVMKQTVHLYECTNGKENFFVLEVRMLAKVEYVQISKETAQNFINAVSAANM